MSKTKRKIAGLRKQALLKISRTEEMPMIRYSCGVAVVIAFACASVHQYKVDHQPNTLAECVNQCAMYVQDAGKAVVCAKACADYVKKHPETQK
jgi:hypothetical protein